MEATATIDGCAFFATFRNRESADRMAVANGLHVRDYGVGLITAKPAAVTWRKETGFSVWDSPSPSDEK